MPIGDKAFTHDHEVSFESLKKFVKPRLGFKKTESLEEILQLIPNYQILHIYGMPGSGKSQMISGVCEELSKHPSRIIWHLQCEEREGALKREWLKLTKRLQEKGLISSELLRSTRLAIHADGFDEVSLQMKRLIDKLNQELSLPLLFVIDDVVHDDEKNFLKALMRCMGDFDCSILKIQLLIATKNKNAIYSQQELDAFGMYRTFHVRGFSTEEALEFLRTERVQIHDESKVEKLAEELAYSPLGLFVVKSYCVKYGSTYEDYYNSLEKEDDVEGEKAVMAEDSDLRGKSHRYDIIRRLLAPVDSDDDDQLMQQRVMKMLSFVSKDHIPIQIIKRFFHVCGQTDLRKQDISAIHLIKRIEKEVNAWVWAKQEDEKLITVHGDVLRALRKNLTAEETAELLSDVVRALAGLLYKDDRMKKDYDLLDAMKNHAEAFSKHCIKYFEKLVEGEHARAKDFGILLGWSKINEVVGFAISQYPVARESYEEDQFFHRAIVCIWNIVSSSLRHSLRSSFISQPHDGTEGELLFDYEKDKDPRQTAERMYNEIMLASTKIPEMDLILRRDWEASYQVKLADLTDMRKRFGEYREIDWTKMIQELSASGDLSSMSKNQLEEKGMIVEWGKLKQYYLAEKIASIMHSRGRLDNYKGDTIPPEMHVRCVWYTKLGFHLCDVAARETKVKSLFHYILRANNQLPRLVRNRAGENDEDFLKRINESRKMARAVMQDTSDFYEHGIYKLVSGTPFTKMNAMKYLVKANTKVHKRPAVVERFPNSEADKECEELYEICKNNRDVMISTTCLVHAAKYKAARGEYEKALDMFESAFSWGIDQKVQKNARTYAWALYNMGRAILKGSDRVSKRQTRVENFKHKCELTLTNETSEVWRERLDELQSKIL